MAEFTLPTGETVLIDDVDIGWVSELTWFRKVCRGKVYIASRMLINGRRVYLYLHRMVLGVRDPETFVDHRSRDTFDNMSANLRPCTKSQNMMNRVQASPLKTSRFKGVYWNTQYRKWCAQISVNHARHYLGRFIAESEAALAYNRAALTHHGEFAALNRV